MYEVAHQIGLIPIAAMLFLGRGLPRELWIVAGAFAVSWVGDSIAGRLGGSFAGSYYWLPVQLALVFAVVRPSLLWLWALLLAAVASWLVSYPGPEWLVTLFASLVIVAYAKGATAVPLVIYFGLGTGAYFWFTLGESVTGWYAYQTCRLLAFGSFIGIVLLYRGEHGFSIGGRARRHRVLAGDAGDSSVVPRSGRTGQGGAGAG